MITPAADMAPVMPTTRPRTSGVWPAKEKPVLERAEEALLRLDRARRPAGR